jgi:hypothetical protein
MEWNGVARKMGKSRAEQNAMERSGVEWSRVGQHAGPRARQAQAQNVTLANTLTPPRHVPRTTKH